MATVASLPFAKVPKGYTREFKQRPPVCSTFPTKHYLAKPLSHISRSIDKPSLTSNPEIKTPCALNDPPCPRPDQVFHQKAAEKWRALRSRRTHPAPDCLRRRAETRIPASARGSSSERARRSSSSRSPAQRSNLPPRPNRSGLSVPTHRDPKHREPGHGAQTGSPHPESRVQPTAS